MAYVGLQRWTMNYKGQRAAQSTGWKGLPRAEIRKSGTRAAIAGQHFRSQIDDERERMWTEYIGKLPQRHKIVLRPQEP